MLPGSVLGQQSVSPNDVFQVRQGLNASIGSPQYNVFRDVTGAGVISPNTQFAVRQQLNKGLPAGNPPAYTFLPAMSGDAVVLSSAGATDGTTTLSDAKVLAWASLGSESVESVETLKKKKAT
jgi:hypothetical protein